MKPFSRRRLVAALLFLAVAAADLPAFNQGQRFAWWKSEESKKELGLTDDQAVEIERIFQSMLPELRQEMEELDRLEARLSALVETSTDEALLARQIDRVETARANLSKTRSLMFVRMRLVLRPEQRERLKALHQQRRDGKPHRPDSRRDGRQQAEPGRTPGSC